MELTGSELREQLDAAVAGGPAPRVDIDDLIRTETRRSRTLYASMAVAAATLGVMLAGAVVFGAGSGDDARPATGATPTATARVTPGPSGTGRKPGGDGADRPCPTLPASGAPRPFQSEVRSPAPVPESCGATTARLDAALTAILRRVVPAVVTTDAAGSGQPVKFWKTHDENLTYLAALRITGGPGYLGVSVVPSTYTPDNEKSATEAYGCGSARNTGVSCVYRILSDGTVVTGATVVSATTDGTLRQIQVIVYRPDNTTIRITSSNATMAQLPGVPREVGAGPPPLSLDQMVTIATDPALHVYP